MKSGPRVLQLSKTPLVGAPGRLNGALNLFTQITSSWVVCEDYPAPLSGLFIADALNLSDGSAMRELSSRSLVEADVIHIHNDVSPQLIDLIRDTARVDCRFVWHAHSPLREGPLFIDRSETLGLPWAAKVTIPHYPPRSFPGHEMLPDIVLGQPSCSPLETEAPVRVLFSPTHGRKGLRWGDKVCENLHKTLSWLRLSRSAEVIEVRGVSPQSLLALRRTTQITIDEVVTGAFHQVSLEGLMCGNCVANAADYFTLTAFQMAVGAKSPPPFVKMTREDVAEQLPRLVKARDRIRSVQEEGREYFTEYLTAERLVQRYVNLYERVLT